MSPDEAYLEKQVKAEEEKLQKKVQALSESDKKDIYEKGQFYVYKGESRDSLTSLWKHFLFCVVFNSGLELLSIQSKTQDASCLPALKVSDIEPTIAVTRVEMGTAGTVLTVLMDTRWRYTLVTLGSEITL